MRSTALLATCTLTVLSVTACGGGGSSSHKSSAGESSPSVEQVATKASFTAASKSDAAATKACQTLIGDGTKEAEWLSSMSTEGGTKVEGALNSHSQGAGFECTVSNKTGEYAGGFYFVQGQEAFQYQVQERFDSTTTKGHVASAWNANSEVGVVTDEASESHNQTAMQD